MNISECLFTRVKLIRYVDVSHVSRISDGFQCREIFVIRIELEIHIIRIVRMKHVDHHLSKCCVYDIWHEKNQQQN